MGLTLDTVKRRRPLIVGVSEALFQAAFAKMMVDVAGKPLIRIESHNAPPPAIRSAPKVGRNAPCPCGSGAKFKKCCA